MPASISDKKKKKKVISQTAYDNDYYSKKGMKDELLSIESKIVIREQNRSKDLIDQDRDRSHSKIKLWNSLDGSSNSLTRKENKRYQDHHSGEFGDSFNEDV